MQDAPSDIRSPLHGIMDLDEFHSSIEQFKAGTLSAGHFKELRVSLGIYEERMDGTFMVRARLFAGILLPHHMKALASAARTYGNGTIHITTRQDAQIHGVPLDNLHAALVHLAETGLSTHGTGGNTIRNVTACPNAGVCRNEAFDVTPYAISLTEFLLQQSNSFHLPRKFKIAFSGCPNDCAGGTVNDIGFIAKFNDGRPGFAVHAGGGLGARSRIADLLEEWVPAGDMYAVAEAIKRVFDKHGNREDRGKARLRFLLDKIGFEAFKELYKIELAHLRDTAMPESNYWETTPPFRSHSETSPTQLDAYSEWRRLYVSPQKQTGYSSVKIPLFQGDISDTALVRLADIIQQFGEGLARATQSQDLTVRWLSDHELPSLHRQLAALGFTAAAAPENLSVCAGASICRLGICQSRELAAAICEEFVRRNLDSSDKLRRVKINISGCPNSCGRHQIGDIGLYGVMRRIDGEPVPHFILQLGGHVEEGATRLAAGKEAVPAEHVPVVLANLLQVYSESEADTFGAFLETGGREIAQDLPLHEGR